MDTLFSETLDESTGASGDSPASVQNDKGRVVEPSSDVARRDALASTELDHASGRIRCEVARDDHRPRVGLCRAAVCPVAECSEIVEEHVGTITPGRELAIEGAAYAREIEWAARRDNHDPAANASLVGRVCLSG